MKVWGILDMQAPTNIKQIRAMWPHRSHILSPLTELTGKKAFVWEDKHQQAFEQMKALIAMDALLVYPNHNKPFDIETDASDYQLGAIIKQDNRPIAYYTRKLNTVQKNYTTIEKELWSIVKTLKEFRSMLLGEPITIYTDHKNLTHKLSSFSTQRILWWRLLLEEFGCNYKHKEGSQNLVANVLSCILTSCLVREKIAGPREKNLISQPNQPQELYEDNQACITEENPSLAECLLVYPVFNECNITRHPFHFAMMQHYQQRSDATKQLLIDQPEQSHLLHSKPTTAKDSLNRWHVAADCPLLSFNSATCQRHGQIGMVAQTTLLSSPSKGWSPQVSWCEICQKMKCYSTSFAQLPTWEATSVPWEQVHVDLIGPWNIKVKGHKKPVQFIALTCSDPILNLLEVGTVKDKMSEQVTKTFKRLWLSRYPRPRTCVHDRGPEFVAHEFQTVLDDTGIGLRPTSARNPQSNGIIEQVHHTIAAIVRIVVDSLLPIDTVEKANDIVQDTLHKAMHVVRCASHNSLDNISPGALTFQWDMYLDIPLIANVLTLANLRQKQIDKHLMRANAKCKTHDYQVGDQVLIKCVLDASSKLEPTTYKGPYPIVQVHTNGTVTVLLQPNTMERYNVRRTTPYRQPLPVPP
jgi:transposase InsO family protein